MLNSSGESGASLSHRWVRCYLWDFHKCLSSCWGSLLFLVCWMFSSGKGLLLSEPFLIDWSDLVFFFFVLLMWFINLWYIDFLLLNYPCFWDKSHLVIVPLMWVQFGDTVDPHLCIPCLWNLLHAKVICNPKMSIMVPSSLFMMLWKWWKLWVTWHAPSAETDQGHCLLVSA